MKDIFSELAEKWPSTFVARKDFGTFSGGAIAPKQMANLDSMGQGPVERLLIGSHVCYPVQAAVDFLRSRSKALA